MGEILNLIESVSGGFPSYFYIVTYYPDAVGNPLIFNADLTMKVVDAHIYYCIMS